MAGAFARHCFRVLGSGGVLCGLFCRLFCRSWIEETVLGKDTGRETSSMKTVSLMIVADRLTAGYIPLSFERFRSSTFTFSEALPLLNTPKFSGGSTYPGAVNELTPSIERDCAHRESTFSNAGRGEAMHQCEACWYLLLLIGGAASRIVLSFFPSRRAWLSLSWVHNLPFFTLAFPSICKSCHVRKYCSTVESGKSIHTGYMLLVGIASRMAPFT